MDKPIPEAVRSCRRCEQTKPLGQFAVDRRRDGGYATECRECKISRDKVRDSRPARKIKQALLQRERVHIYRDQQKATRTRRQRERGWPRPEQDPVKAAARRAVVYAVRTGRLIKPECCEDCGRQKAARDLHGHHEDYAKPLDVAWLCAACHMARHRKYPDDLASALAQHQEPTT